MHPSHPSTSLLDAGFSKRPRDARLIHLLLANMGAHAYTERVPLQLLDFSYRYTSSILSDALAYEPPVPSAPSGKKAKDTDEGITSTALRTAIQSRSAHQFTPALPKETLLEIAAERNRIALPRVEREFGVRLPPERYCFTGLGWGVREAWEEEVSVVDEDVEMGGGMGVGGPVERHEVEVDAEMGGMEDEDEEQFEEVMGRGDVGMGNA